LIPSTPESWIFLLLACVIGFVMGQWIKARRKKRDAHEEAAENIRKGLAYADKAAKKGKAKKRSRKVKSAQNS